MGDRESHPLSIAALLAGPQAGDDGRAAPSTPSGASADNGRARASEGISCMNCRTTATPLWRRDPQTGAHLCNRCGLYLKTYNVMHPLTRIKRRPISTLAGTRRAAVTAAAAAAPVAAAAAAAAAGGVDDVEQVPRPANCSPAQLQQLAPGARQRRPATAAAAAQRVTPKQQMRLGITPRCFNCSAESTPLWRRDPADNIICNACGLYYKLHGAARPVSMRRASIRRRNRVAPAAPGHAASVPAAGASAGSAAAPRPLPDRLATLAQAAALGHGGCTMLESLASVAAAEIVAKDAPAKSSVPPGEMQPAPFVAAAVFR
ncbi:GATA type transcriptional activator of nitrogen-regulated proteins [Coemansia javaensis]|uniref:GATA type transcriptional activator of nitrogen-regulated proteins n=1 Tax=Coemansia javaensis TaxID=2761396 RepID=A0A9W8HLU8_9FUNG|nr:GATA type transcriptional activator of nitrogen-regulated proteins [Coemansia javaensis]